MVYCSLSANFSSNTWNLPRMNFLFLLVILGCSLLINSIQSDLHKRGRNKKTTIPSKSIIDDFLDDALLSNDIRTHFPTHLKKLDKATYLPTLKRALSYATGIFEGVHYDVETFLQSPAILEEQTKPAAPIIKELMVQDPVNTFKNLTVMNALMYIESFQLKAKLVRSKWFLYKTALENLIAYEKPHVSFFELITNIFVGIDIENNFDLMTQRVANMGRRDLLEEIYESKGLLSMHHPTQSTDPIMKVVVLLDEYQHIDKNINSPQFDSNFKKLIQLSYKFMDLEKETGMENAIFGQLEERIVHLEFIQILRPLYVKNQNFLHELDGIKKMDAVSQRLPKEPIEVFGSRIRYAFEASLNASPKKFLFENLVYHTFDSKFNQIMMIKDENYKLLFNFITHSVKEAIFDFKQHIKANPVQLFRPKSLMYQPDKIVTVEKVVDNLITSDSSTSSSSDDDEELYRSIDYTLYTQYAPAIPIIQLITKPLSPLKPLKPRFKQTLNQLMHGNVATGLSNLKWIDIQSLIIAMQGSVTAVGGSVKIIFIPGMKAFPTRFDEPHPDTRMGFHKSITLRKIFKRWGVDPDDYE